MGYFFGVLEIPEPREKIMLSALSLITLLSIKCRFSLGSVFNAFGKKKQPSAMSKIIDDFANCEKSFLFHGVDIIVFFSDDSGLGFFYSQTQGYFI